GGALADDGDLLERRTRIQPGTRPVIDAPGQVSLDLGTVIGLLDGQTRAAGLVRALQAELAHLGRDVHVRLAAHEAAAALFGALGTHAAAVIGDAAFLVGDDDLHAVTQDGALEQSFVGSALLGVDPHDRAAVVGDRGDDALDALSHDRPVEQIGI